MTALTSRPASPCAINARHTPHHSITSPASFSRDLGVCFQQLHTDPACRAVVLSGAGRLFCAGIDMADLASLGSVAMGEGDSSRKAFLLHPVIKQFQDWITDVEKVGRW